MVGSGKYIGRGVTQEPAGFLLQHTKVPPIEVGFCAECHPWSECIVLFGGGLRTEGYPNGIVIWYVGTYASTGV